MSTADANEPAVPKSGLHKLLSAEADLGIEMAADPVNANLPDLHLRLTNLNSAWFARTCRVCKDTFREGDQVRVCPKCGEAYHDDSQFGLHCWHKRFAGGKPCKEGGHRRFAAGAACDFRWQGQLPATAGVLPASAEGLPHAAPPAALVYLFLRGLETVWRPYGDQQAVRVLPGTPPVGRSCPWCRSRVRAGDYAVECPCRCGTFFHQDVFRHLTCWNEWFGVKGNDFCPNTGRPLRPRVP